MQPLWKSSLSPGSGANQVSSYRMCSLWHADCLKRPPGFSVIVHVCAHVRSGADTNAFLRVITRHWDDAMGKGEAQERREKLKCMEISFLWALWMCTSIIEQFLECGVKRSKPSRLHCWEFFYVPGRKKLSPHPSHQKKKKKMLLIIYDHRMACIILCTFTHIICTTAGS